MERVRLWTEKVLVSYSLRHQLSSGGVVQLLTDIRSLSASPSHSTHTTEVCVCVCVCVCVYLYGVSECVFHRGLSLCHSYCHLRGGLRYINLSDRPLIHSLNCRQQMWPGQLETLLRGWPVHFMSFTE